MTARSFELGELKQAWRDVAQRDDLIAEMEQTQHRLQYLYEISTLLLRFETVERTVQEVMERVARSLHLRSAIFIKTSDSLQTLLWQLASEPKRALREAKAHAQDVYHYLVPDCPDLFTDDAEVYPLAQPRRATAEGLSHSEDHFVLLPFVVRHGSIFGALQIESAKALSEPDLVFINAVANQLASALHRDCVDRQLRASEAKLAGILTIAADAVISFDDSQRIVMYNEGAEKIFGWSKAEAIDRPIFALLAEDSREAAAVALREFTKGAQHARRIGGRHSGIVAQRKSGELFPADAAISKLSVDGAWLFTVILRDVSEQHRVEHEETYLAEAGAVLATTLDSERTLANIANLALREFAGFCIVEFVKDADEPAQLVLMTADPREVQLSATLMELRPRAPAPALFMGMLNAGRPFVRRDANAEALHGLAQSKEHELLLSVLAPSSLMGVPLRVAGQLVGALIVGSWDVARRYSAADLKLLAQLAERAALALESARLYVVAQRAVQSRDEALGVVAHDLRNPIGSILLQTRLARRGAPEPDRRSRNGSEIIERAARRINRLIEDLMDVTRLDAGRLSIECARLLPAQVLAEIAEAQRPLLASRKLSFHLASASTLPSIWADHDRLQQILENLVGNAVKFTQRGGSVELAARALEREIEFRVTDTGEGIAAEHIPHLFDRFWQAHKSERRGAGLGLAIAKGLVESHGGRIWVESTPGVGTTFFFTVPLASAVHAEGSA